jgi:hypothetical protein
MTTLTTEAGPFTCRCLKPITREAPANGWRDEDGDQHCPDGEQHAPAVETDPREVLIVTDADSEPVAAAVKTPTAPWNLPFTLRADDETWTLGDSDSRTVVIARRGADVFVVDSGGALRFEGVKRDLFARCFEAAGRSADEAATTTEMENGQ